MEGLFDPKLHTFDTELHTASESKKDAETLKTYYDIEIQVMDYLIDLAKSTGETKFIYQHTPSEHLVKYLESQKCKIEYISKVNTPLYLITIS